MLFIIYNFTIMNNFVFKLFTFQPVLKQKTNTFWSRLDSLAVSNYDPNRLYCILLILLFYFYFY